MQRTRYCSLHPDEEEMPREFFYGDMHAVRKPIDPARKPGKGLLEIFHSYVKSGIFPPGTSLIGDYLEHALTKRGQTERALAGRYPGIVMPDGSYQYVRLDGESIGVNKSKLKTPEEIVVLTDTCLFCAASATATLKTGETVSIVAPSTTFKAGVAEIHVAERLCPYEIDAITRLTDLISSLITGNKAYRKAVLAMPTVEYYFYLMEAYNAGWIETNLMRQWIDQVRRHAEKISRAISKRIKLETESCQPLYPVKEYIEGCVNNGDSTDFARVLNILSAGSELWRDVLSISPPGNWKDLNYTNYAISILETARLNGNAGRFTLDIENPTEQRIMRNASKLAGKLARQAGKYRFSAVGIYPHEKVFVSGDDCSGSFPRLYYLDRDLSSGERIFREIIEANRRKVPPHA
ncbi:MAG: hypothetical protein R6U89_00915 [Dehalococcoidia bacterium]